MGAGQTSERQIWTTGICVVKLGFIIDFADDVVHPCSLWTLALDQTSPGQTTKYIFICKTLYFAICFNLFLLMIAWTLVFLLICDNRWHCKQNSAIKKNTPEMISSVYCLFVCFVFNLLTEPCHLLV